MLNNRPILLVEDDIVDHMLVRRALTELNVQNRLEIATSGEFALSYLREGGGERPGIIILDLNMPRMSGIELMKVLKADEDMQAIPVIILTTSREEQDKLQAFKLGAAGYMVKPVEYPAFVEMVRTLAAYWTLSDLPA